MHSKADPALCESANEMSAEEIFAWNFEGGELMENVKVRDGSRGREIDILHKNEWFGGLQVWR